MSEEPPREPPDDIEAKRRLLQNLLRQGQEQDRAVRATPTPAYAVSAPVEAPRRRESTPVASRVAAEPYRPPERPTRSIPARAREAPTRTETGLFTYDQVGRVAVFVIRLLAFGVLFGSFFGSVLAVDGNWKPSLYFWQGIDPVSAAVGVALQIEITLVEWWRGANWKDPLYLLHLAIDAALTFVGYWPYVREGLTEIAETLVQRIAATSAPLTMLGITAGCVFFALCVLAARFPEMVFIKPAPTRA